MIDRRPRAVCGEPSPGQHHPCRQRPHSRPALRSGLVLLAPSQRWCRHPPAPARRSPGHGGPVVDRPGAPLEPLPSAGGTRTCARSWLPPWPGSSPGSCGPRWWPRTEHDLPVGQGAIGAARTRVLRDAPEHRRSRSDPRRRYVQTSSLRGLHGRPYSEATTCEWLYCDSDSRTSSWRFSDPLRSGVSSSTSRPITTLTFTGSE